MHGAPPWDDTIIAQLQANSPNHASTQQYAGGTTYIHVTQTIARHELDTNVAPCAQNVAPLATTKVQDASEDPLGGALGRPQGGERKREPESTSEGLLGETVDTPLGPWACAEASSERSWAPIWTPLGNPFTSHKRSRAPGPPNHENPEVVMECWSFFKSETRLSLDVFCVLLGTSVSI